MWVRCTTTCGSAHAQQCGTGNRIGDDDDSGDGDNDADDAANANCRVVARVISLCARMEFFSAHAHRCGRRVRARRCSCFYCDTALQYKYYRMCDRAHTHASRIGLIFIRNDTREPLRSSIRIRARAHDAHGSQGRVL